MFHRRLLFLMACVLAACAGSASGIDWPADFWTQVTNHVTAVAPTADQVKVSAEKADWDFIAAYMDIRYGTAENPFDTRFGTVALSTQTTVRSFPAGLKLSFR